MPNYDFDKRAQIIGDRRKPYSIRISSLKGITSNILHLLRENKFPDFKYSLSVFFALASNPVEAAPLCEAVIVQGIQQIIRANSLHHSLMEKDDPNFVQTVRLMRKNIGEPDYILSRLLEIAENESNPEQLRKTALSSGTFIRSCFNNLCLNKAKEGYIQPEEIAERFVKLEHLTQALK